MPNLTNEARRTHIRHTKGYIRGWRIFSTIVLVAGCIGLTLASKHPDAPFGLCGGMLVFAGIVWLIFSLGGTGEPRGSGWVRQFISEGEDAVRRGDVGSAQSSLKDIARFVDYYSMDLPDDLEDRIRVIEEFCSQDPQDLSSLPLIDQEV